MRHPVLALLLAAACPMTWAAGEGVSFQHKDWELACDNTRTCRAAGYQRDGDENAVSVLLTRTAGAGKAVTGEMALGSMDREKFPARVTLQVDGKTVGPVVIKDAQGRLDAPQVAALLAALLRTSDIRFVAGQESWRLSGDGAAAVLLKMDEAQGRVGTVGALAKKGPAAEDKVLAAVPMPVVQVPPVLPKQAGDAALAARIAAELKKTDDSCDDLKANKEPLQLWRLSASKVLVSTRCWLAAYNSGSGYWVANDQPPYAPQLVTTDGSDYDGAGQILAQQKGRGIGDCWGREEWAWNGTTFVHTAVSSTGMCRLVAPGGVWQLPTLVTEVRAARGAATGEKKK